MGPDSFPPRRSDTPRAPVRSTGGDFVGDCVLEGLLHRRLRACRALNVPVPRDVRRGPRSTLLWRVSRVDRRLTRALELRGGVQLPPWPPDEDDFPDDEPEEIECPV